MRFNEEELITLETVLTRISMDEKVSDRLYRKYAKILEKVKEDVNNSRVLPVIRRLKNKP